MKTMKTLTINDIPKSYRLTNPIEINKRLEKEIEKQKFQLEFLIKELYNKNCIKKLRLEVKFLIYMHNGDVYNIIKTMKKIKDLSFIMIEEYEEQITTQQKIRYISDTGKEIEGEGGYLEFCNNVKKETDRNDRFLKGLENKFLVLQDGNGNITVLEK